MNILKEIGIGVVVGKIRKISFVGWWFVKSVFVGWCLS